MRDVGCGGANDRTRDPASGKTETNYRIV